MKTCTCCRKRKSLSSFYRSKIHSQGRLSWCISCCSKSAQRRRAERRFLRGLTIVQIEQLLEKECGSRVRRYIKDYFVSSGGDVFSTKFGRILKLCQTHHHTDGRCAIAISHLGKEQTKLVHRLVLKTFVGPCPNGMECRHLDGNPRNNNLSNLRWGTVKENQADRIRHGTDNRGERCGHAKLTERSVREILRLRKTGTESATSLSKKYGVSSSTICDIIARRTWGHVA